MFRDHSSTKTVSVSLNYTSSTATIRIKSIKGSRVTIDINGDKQTFMADSNPVKHQNAGEKKHEKPEKGALAALTVLPHDGGAHVGDAKPESVNKDKSSVKPADNNLVVESTGSLSLGDIQSEGAVILSVRPQ